MDYLVLLEYRNAIDTHVGYCIKLNVISSILAVFYKKKITLRDQFHGKYKFDLNLKILKVITS